MNRLSVRLSLAFLLSAWIGIGAMVLVVQRTLDIGFRQYINARDSAVSPEQPTRLESILRREWLMGRRRKCLLSGRGAGGGGGSAGRGASNSRQPLLDGTIVASTDSTQVGTWLSGESMAAAIPLVVNDTQVVWLFASVPGVQALGGAESCLLERSKPLVGRRRRRRDLL